MIINPFRYYWPPSLFAAGEQGAWYDPAEFSTLFQDSAGTTPVTAVEQAVGLMLDKSKGLVLGSELVTNGDGTTLTGWTSVNDASCTTAVSGGQFVLTTVTGGAARLRQTVPVTSGRFYRITLFAQTNNNSTSGAIQVWGTNYGSGLLYAAAEVVNGTVSAVVLATSANLYLQLNGFNSTVGVTNYFDNISVRELPGNHAYQTTSTSRPTLRARYNLLTYSEQFDNAAWAKSNVTVTANAVTAPDGTASADTLADDNAGGTGVVGITRNVTITNATHIFSFYAKANGLNWVSLQITGFTSAAVAGACYYDLANGVVGGTNQIAGTITPVGNSWYRCTGIVTPDAGDLLGNFAIYVADANNDIVVDRDGTSSIYIWGADLRVANDGVGIPAYQRIAAATDYDTAGFPVYLAFDGSDDSLLTNSIDFSGTDKMTVFAGVRKLSDAAQSVVAELSATIASNNGTFLLSAPNSAAANYNFSSKGTTLVDNTVTTYTAPITSVIAAAGNISAPSNVIRINGSQAGSQTGSQGTGNYGNFAMYIGRRNNASLPASMRLYSLIVRGATTSDAQIAAIETWVNSRARAC